MHTYVRLRGHGLTVVPFAPFAVRRIGDGLDDRIVVEHGDRQALLDPRHGDGVASAADVADVARADGPAEWLMEFGRFALPWPNGFALCSSDAPGVPFDLVGAAGELVFVRGPLAAPFVDAQLVGTDQRVTARGVADDVSWLELHYELEDGSEWAQRHWIVDRFVVTAQVPRAAGAAAFDAAGALAAGIAAGR